MHKRSRQYVSIAEPTRGWPQWIRSSSGWLLAYFLFCPVALSQTGEEIYRDQCAECHGEKGEGVEGAYENQLTGILTPFELEQYISQTMPEGDESACVGPEAQKVTKYIFEKFYSLEAQNRIAPPKYVFSRLTGQQYQNSVADILGNFLNRKEDRPRKYGLRGIYYSSRSMRKENQVNDRIDSTIDFDFGEGSPEKVKGKEFSIRWSGSLIAEESGEYEIIVESANSVRLRLNAGRKPLVDANVVSGDRSEYRSTVNLLEGRLYDLSIDVSRFKEKNGFVRISWVRPSGVKEIIPASNYCTNRMRPLAMLDAKFPPDDESYGYPRGISISKGWSDSVSKAAIETSQLVIRYLDLFVKPNANKEQRRIAAKEFCTKVATLAFRQQLTPALQRLYVDSHFEDASIGLRECMKRSLVLIFKSPRFLYLDLGQKQDPPAYVLSRVYWDSVPTAALLTAQNKNQLIDKNSVNPLLDRMLDDQRARTKISNFFAHYLKWNDLHSLEKDEQSYPGFDHTLANDLKRSIRLQIDDLVWNANGSLKDLMLTDNLMVNQRIAEFYGWKIPDGTEKKQGEYAAIKNPNGRGILIHPLLMSGFAYSKSSSPIHRGVFVTKNIMGRRLNPPPDSFPPFDGEIARTWTTREKVSFQTKPVSCQRCHGLINNLGFAFEAYDAVGNRRKTDNDKPVDTKWQYRTFDGKLVKYEGAEELAKFLSESPAVHQHFVNELFQFLVKQPLAAYGQEATARLNNHFRENNFEIRSLIREIGKVAALYPPNR